MRLGVHGAPLQACGFLFCIPCSWTFSPFLLLPLSQAEGEGQWQSQIAASSVWLMFLVFTCGAEADRLAAVDASLRSQFFQRNFSGKLLDAECSSLGDKAAIHQELLQSGKEREVELAVQDLVRMNTFSSELQHAADLAGPLGDMSSFSWRGVMLAMYLWLCFPFLIIWSAAWNHAYVLGIFMMVQAVVWLVTFLRPPSDRKCFSSAALAAWLGTFPLIFLGQSLGSDTFVLFFGLGSLCLGPFCLCMSVAGPHRIARIPLLGPRLVRMLIGRSPNSCQWRGAAEPQQPEAPEEFMSKLDVVIDDATISI